MRGLPISLSMESLKTFQVDPIIKVLPLKVYEMKYLFSVDCQCNGRGWQSNTEMWCETPWRVPPNWPVCHDFSGGSDHLRMGGGLISGSRRVNHQVYSCLDSEVIWVWGFVNKPSRFRLLLLSSKRVVHWTTLKFTCSETCERGQ